MATTKETRAGLETPDLLYHTVLTVIDYHTDASGGTRSVYVLGTHSTLEAAKKFTATALQGLGYQPDEFAEFAAQQPGAGEGAWKHGDGILVFAKAPAGQEFRVGIDTTPNNAGLAASADGGVVLPQGTELLHYVLQTTVDYNADRTGCVQTTEIEGCYVRRADAWAAANGCLDKAQFAEYDARDSPDFAGEWPYGDDVIVHAVADSGENTIVAVRTVPGAHQRHGKKSKPAASA